MAEWSALWATVPPAVGPIAGDQQVGYTQSHWSDIGRILAACAGFEGVASGYEDELNASVFAAETVRMTTGGGIVDGKIYDNTTVVDVNIPAAAAGNVRIDRIVLRCNWATYTVRLVVLTGISVIPPAVPAPPVITQNTGVTYDITLWQALVNDGGGITLTDERVFGVNVDGVTIQRIGGILSIAPNGVGNVQLRDSAGLSVIGRATNALGDPADIIAVNDDEVLRRSGVVLGFGQVATEGLADGAVTDVKHNATVQYGDYHPLYRNANDSIQSDVEGNARGQLATDLQRSRDLLVPTRVASGARSTIAGGEENTASGSLSTVGGGQFNAATGGGSVISGGSGNNAAGSTGSVGGGRLNSAFGDDSAVAGGYLNSATGEFAAVPGGTSNVAQGDYSLAAGRRAATGANAGVFIWADSEDAAFIADRANQFKVRASGNVHFRQNNAAAAQPVLELSQADIDDTFVNFIGTSAADQTRSISTLNGDGLAVDGPMPAAAAPGWAYAGMVRVDINGAEYWMPFYTADPGP